MPAREASRPEVARRVLIWGTVAAFFAASTWYATFGFWIGLQALFARYPDLAIAGAPTRRGTRTLRGYETLPVRLGRRPTKVRVIVTDCDAD